MRALLLALALASLPALAHAEVGVVVTGDSTIQPQLAAQVEDWLRTHGQALLAAPLRPDALTSLLDCFVIEDLACARKIVEASAQSTQLVFAKAEYGGTAGARDLTITAYWFDRGKDAMAVRRVCERCADGQLRETLDDVMTSLGAGAPTRVSTTISTTPAAVSETPPEPARVRGPLPYVVAGAGVALLVTGIVLVGTSEDDTGERYEYRDTTAGGVTLSVLGVAAIAAGAYLYLRAPHATPTVAVVPGGAYVGWGRAF